MKIQLVDENNFGTENIRSLVKFQSLWRGYRVRRNFLSRITYNLAIEFIEQNPDMIGIPKAATGVTKVFLPVHLPIVLKALGEQKSKNRFFTMWKVRDLCRQFGYNNLLIPRARPFNGYNLEDKFPVHDVKQREQIALYEKNRDNFSQVVKEFTGFLCQCIFPDILTYSHPYSQADNIPLARCDNIPLLIDQNVGKIALIDLGGLQIRTKLLNINEAIDCAKTAIYIFPYHFTEILEIIRTFCPEIDFRIFALRKICRQTIIQFNCIYADHEEFITKKNLLKTQSVYLQSEMPIKIQLFIEQIIASHGTQVDMNFFNKRNISLFSKNIIEPIIEKLIDNQMNCTSDFKIRIITINCEPLFDAFSDRQDLVNAKVFLQLILNQFLNIHEICYANLYLTRFKKSYLRIHY